MPFINVQPRGRQEVFATGSINGAVWRIPLGKDIQVTQRAADGLTSQGYTYTTVTSSNDPTIYDIGAGQTTDTPSSSGGNPSDGKGLTALAGFRGGDRVQRVGFKQAAEAIAPFLPGSGGGSGGPLTEIGFFLASAAAFATTTIPASAVTVRANGYAAAGDAPAAAYRRATDAEVALGLGATYTSQDGAKWILAETTVIPEWFGAKGNASGMSATNPNPLIAAAAGADDAPAFRSMLAFMSALKVHGTTLPSKKYRMGSHVQHVGGQKAVLLPGSNTHWHIRSDIIHDSYDPVSGDVQFIFTNGQQNARVNTVRLIHDGAGFIHPSDAVKPRADAKKGSITMYFVDDFEIIRVRKSGPSPTNFQISIFHSSTGYVDGGNVGYPVGPTGIGDDGCHIIGACSDIRIRNLVINSGDDPISLTHEFTMTGRVMERIFIDNIICTTPIANLVKIHIINDEASLGAGAFNKTNGCVIQDVYISNVQGRLLGNEKGAVCTINNDDYTKGNIIRRIYIDKLDGKIGTLPKTEVSIALQQMAIRVHRADEVHFTDTVVTGQQNAQVLFSNSKGSSFNGTLINDPTNTSSVPLATGLSVASALLQGSGRRRITFTGTPDLSAVAAEVAAWNADIPTNVIDIKLPILTLAGMTVAGHNGSFVIKAVDNTAKWVEVDNLRSGTADESAATGTGSIQSGTMPVVVMLDCEKCKVNARVISPLSWATAYVAGRNGTSKWCEVVLDIEGQRFGHAIYAVRMDRCRFGFTGRDCKSGSIGMYAAAGGSLTTPYNHFLQSDDFDALADPQQGWARTVVSDFIGDRFDLIRGRTPTRLQGSVTQAAGSTLVGGSAGINANVSTYGGAPYAGINARHLRSLTPRSGGHDGIADLNWDSANAKFVINTKTAPTTAVTWDYVIGAPD